MNAAASTPETPAHQQPPAKDSVAVFAPTKKTDNAFLPTGNHTMETFASASSEDREPSLAGVDSEAGGRSSPQSRASSVASADDSVPAAAAAAAPESPGISAEEQARRDEQASIELARAMMEEEAMASYQVSYEISMDYLRNNQAEFSQEDLAALEAAVQEEEAADAEGNEVDVSGMSYDMMLRLGEQIGDVKLERWAQKAQQVIESLPLSVFDPSETKESPNDCDVKCLVCQCQYEKGEKIRTLSCQHCFHAECVDQWLLSKDFCPYCRTSLEKEEEG